MTFFNSKQEVIEIELTPYGKYKLSRGEFTPDSYAFFDDNVLYNTELSAGDSRIEAQNNSESRIQERTPVLKTQNTFRAVEFRDNEHFYANNNPLIESKYGLLSEMGNCSLSTEHNAAWDIKMYKGELTGSNQGYVEYLTGSTSDRTTLEHTLLRIPQIEAEAVYKTHILDINNVAPNIYTDYNLPTGRSALSLSTISEGNVPIEFSKIWSDGSYIRVKEDYFIIDVAELNVDFKMKNFDIELFKFEETLGPSGEKETELVPLTFLKKTVSIKNGMLLDDAITDYDYNDQDISASEYYFEVAVDHELTRDEICAAIGELKSAGYLIDSPVYCDDDPTGQFYDIYNYDQIGDKECPD